MIDDLFEALDSPAGWRVDPRAAFLQWLSGYRPDGRRLRQSTCLIYSGMFERLLCWTQGRGLSLFDLKPEDYEAFVASRGLGEETRHRYLLLFTALFRHLNVSMEENAALSLLRKQPAPESGPSAVLMPGIVNRIVQDILSSPGRTWKHRRNQAMISMALGAGVHSHEIRAFKAQWIEKAGSGHLLLRLPRHDVLPERKIPLLPVRAFRARLLDWMEERARLEIPGMHFFPADDKGAEIHASTLYRIVDRALSPFRTHETQDRTDETQTEAPFLSGPSLLRNTFCAMAQTIHHVAEVKSFMGHAQVRSTLELARPQWRLEDVHALS